MTNDFYAVWCDDSHDGTHQGKANAEREAKDLRKMGFEVTILGPLTGELADMLQTLTSLGVTLATAKRIVKECK